jgi:hypothetical protein
MVDKILADIANHIAIRPHYDNFIGGKWDENCIYSIEQVQICLQSAAIWRMSVKDKAVRDMSWRHQALKTCQTNSSGRTWHA